MTYAGIDYDTHAIHVVRLELDSDEARYDKVRLDVGPGDYMQRVRRMRDLLPARGAWADDGVCLIAIEQPKGPFFKGSIPLAVVLGGLLTCLPRDDKPPVLMIETQEWKKWSLGGGFPGQGNAAKPDVAHWARRNWENVPPHADQNALDAFCVAWAARAMSENAGIEPSTGRKAA